MVGIDLLVGESRKAEEASGHELYRGTVTVFGRRDWGKLRNTSARTAICRKTFAPGNFL